MSGKGKSKLNQSSKSTSSKKMRRKRDISPVRPYSEFPATTSTFSGLAILLSTFLGFLGINNTYAASSISISLSGNVSLNLLKDNSQPVFGTSTVATANVTSDHFTGYTLTIQGANDSGKLENGDGSKYLTSIGEAINENTFRTNSDYNDKWGFLPDTLYDDSTHTAISNTNYQPSPIASVSTTIDHTTSPNPSGTDYKLALGAKVTPSMSLDSYGQTFVLAATGNGYDYYLGYTDDQQNLPANTYGNTQSSTINVSSNVPTKDGWVFRGWCDVPTTSNGTVCPGNQYQPGDPITLDGDVNNNINLHAIWARGYDTFDEAFQKAGKSKPSGYNYYAMQDIDSDICTKILVGTLGTLIDTRNNETYAVAKYADNHCWMRQNLNLSMTAGVGITAYNFATGSTFTYTPEQYGTTQTTTGTAWADNASDGARSYGGDKDKYIGGTIITTSGSVSGTGQPYEKIGILYNWAAATAQSGSAAAAATSEVSTSICPKGWRLPANEGNYSYSVLMGSYGLPVTNQSASYSGQLQNPLNYNRPGNYRNDDGSHSLSLRGNGGYYSSSEGYGLGHSRGFGFDNRFLPRDSHYKGNGLSIRCVAV